MRERNLRVLLTVCIVMLRPAKLVETVTIMRKRKRTERQREGESERVREGGRERERERDCIWNNVNVKLTSTWSTTRLCVCPTSTSGRECHLMVGMRLRDSYSRVQVFEVPRDQHSH